MTADLIAVVTTVATRADAQRLATVLVQERLVACAQIDAIESVYHWEDAVQHGPEHRITFKTRRSLWAAVQAAVRAAHPYTLPALHAVALEEVDPGYAAWVVAETREPAP